MSVYHSGSRAVQDRVGVRDLADHMGRAIGEGVRPVVAAFLELQPLLVLGAADPADGRVWASAVTGAPGFVRATGPRRISVATGVPRASGGAGGLLPTDPLATASATAGIPVGTLVLDPRTRRRVRLNGRLRPTPRGFAVETDRVFANCPQYIQRRTTYETVDRAPGSPRRGAELTDIQRDFLAGSDTFFLATVRPGGAGAEVSHRGGNPGFVRITSPRTLTWPDHPGNSMFLTLGNLAADPRAGLLFLDWTTGRTLQLTGEARTRFAPDGERTVLFTVTEAVDTSAALPLRWSAPEYSPANPDPTG
ncbi:pyridoxamine 5'-phosphate oxidase family protein [Streptomyces rishiriensis]|uniref:Pyridoxine 5'-phosphate oxidase superfamily flavin-nucleotide-binding protein n=1 Tax=Streptomyces rishiriensis TaxID=68264 RepID=A0ABU0NR78_STRRH|nr:pyridoxamine 5'-phosphate oxidase family protein [Streptomyces rishiriensis]MDQ0581052.1 putative pyridoxine 5'-phosphate oxidase superfamily flavin-nucleotide-binding protein [Streptomyces rishiriensis]